MKSASYNLLWLVALVWLAQVSLSAQVRIVPIAEGWAKNSINTAIFRKNSIVSFRGKQYAAFYDANKRVVIARRSLKSTNWQINTSKFSGNTTDAHNSISLAIDGLGFLHLAWNHHNSALQYARSISAESLELTETLPMIGKEESKVSYPEFYNFPNGDLLFQFRDGGSGNGNLVLNRFDVKRQKWVRLQNNLISGEGQRNAYAQTTVDKNGTIHLSWVWRETPDVATNHDLCYARSTDGGMTWEKSNSEKYQLPITANTAEYVWKIPPKSELINQTSMTTDDSGNPFITTYWRDADSDIPNYRIVYFKGNSWKQAQVSKRQTAFSLSGGGTKRIPISRPQIVVDRKRIIVFFRDLERQNRVSVANCRKSNPSDCRISDLSETDVGMWEPTIDHTLWKQKKTLHLFIQKVGQGDSETLENLPPQMVSILEWKP